MIYLSIIEEWTIVWHKLVGFMTGTFLKKIIVSQTYSDFH
jgi:hypothetical protein